MIEKISQLLQFAFRQEAAMYKLVDSIKGLFNSGFSFKRFFAGIMVIIDCFSCIVFDTPVNPTDKALDLSDYQLVFCDEFEGDTLDTDAWYYRGRPDDGAGHNSPSQVKLKDGNLVITGEYLENGEHGAGWYAEEIALNKLYCKGYFEIRCICSKSNDYWSAFWIQSPAGPYTHEISQGGVGGAEIDIFEATSADYKLKRNQNSVTTTIHCNGVDDDPDSIDSRILGIFRVDNDIYTNYNTYGLEWTDDEYIFYINGKETSRTSFGKGVSQIPEIVLVSLCPPLEIDQNKDYKTQFVVDYVKIWQK